MDQCYCLLVTTRRYIYIIHTYIYYVCIYILVWFTPRRIFSFSFFTLFMLFFSIFDFIDLNIMYIYEFIWGKFVLIVIKFAIINIKLQKKRAKKRCIPSPLRWFYNTFIFADQRIIRIVHKYTNTFQIHVTVIQCLPRKGFGSSDSDTIITLYIYPSVHNQLCEFFSRDGRTLVLYNVCLKKGSEYFRSAVCVQRDR